jgi:hypothetical protein
VRSRIVGAARFFDWSKFHEFDAGGVGIVEVERPLAVAADFGAIVGGGAVGFDLGLGGVDVADAERKMILYT